ncbi:phage repressor protein CI [Proteus faecis]|uniref:Phage repressor protein CI n=1 Tax=Proteus faecis TaxID=2050967 RepID=A0AAW7CRP1_9GAMM|nr:phage repressor protein CI [Proteus faecis]MDL5166676.1 phage repressor protein CI [Proteus faecis]MDL5274689.1 phage repressor protein CI [Proteus faecis]MDL5278230.1 phage repressor protein CI [Proteus faecis]MDL5307232.1 phage repressor protein CI [Proteus faecis]MDL5310788.1 phage repressor protein CI [Proteus faecis]
MNQPFDFVFCENSGEVLDRIIKAYGFTSKIMLAEHFNMGASGISGRYKRNNFPADMVVRCMYETGANLEWLAFGEGKPFNHEKLDNLKISNFQLKNGQLIPSDHIMFDKVIFPNQSPLPSEPISIQDGDSYFIIDKKYNDVFDGKWLIEIDGKNSIRELTRMPMQRVRVSGVGMAFDCELADLTVIGRVVATITID